MLRFHKHVEMCVDALNSRHQDSDSETPMAEVKTMMEGQIKRGRKSLNKTFDRFSNIIDPSNIALPESPVNL